MSPKLLPVAALLCGCGAAPATELEDAPETVVSALTGSSNLRDTGPQLEVVSEP